MLGLHEQVPKRDAVASVSRHWCMRSSRRHAVSNSSKSCCFALAPVIVQVHKLRPHFCSPFGAFIARLRLISGLSRHQLAQPEHTLKITLVAFLLLTFRCSPVVARFAERHQSCFIAVRPLTILLAFTVLLRDPHACTDAMMDSVSKSAAVFTQPMFRQESLGSSFPEC